MDGREFCLGFCVFPFSLAVRADQSWKEKTNKKNAERRSFTWTYFYKVLVCLGSGLSCEKFHREGAVKNYKGLVDEEDETNGEEIGD